MEFHGQEAGQEVVGRENNAFFLLSENGTSNTEFQPGHINGVAEQQELTTVESPWQVPVRGSQKRFQCSSVDQQHKTYNKVTQTSREVPWSSIKVPWRFHGGSIEVPFSFHGGSMEFHKGSMKFH